MKQRFGQFVPPHPDSFLLQVSSSTDTWVWRHCFAMSNCQKKMPASIKGIDKPGGVRFQWTSQFGTSSQLEPVPDSYRCESGIDPLIQLSPRKWRSEFSVVKYFFNESLRSQFIFSGQQKETCRGTKRAEACRPECWCISCNQCVLWQEPSWQHSLIALNAQSTALTTSTKKTSPNWCFRAKNHNIIIAFHPYHNYSLVWSGAGLCLNNFSISSLLLSTSPLSTDSMK